MPESDEKKELGGLARSIDALFSQPDRTPAVEASEPGALDAFVASGETRLDSAFPAVGLEPDLFESLDGPVEEWVEPEPSAARNVARADAPEEVAWESLETQDGSEEMAFSDAWGAEGHESESEVEVESESEVDAIVATPPLPMEAPADEPASASAESALADAVEAFLSGQPGGADEVRAAATKLQDRLSLDPLADAVERLVHDGDDGPASDEAIALAQEVINPAVASRLVQRMGHTEDDEKRAAYVVLSQRLGIVMAHAFRGALTDSTDARVRRAYYDGLIAMGDTSRPVIEAMVEDDNRFLVRNGVTLLGEIGGEGAIGLVTSTLANTDARVRCAAITSLAKLGGEDSGQLVLASLEDPDSKVRAAAAVAAGELGVERALKPILGLLDQEADPDDLVSLLRGLGRLGDPGAVQAIEKRAVTTLFSRPPTEVRVAAYRALHEIGTPHARALIERARSDKDPVVRTTVRALATAE